jgi:ectoine hydroxylase-related dioxygenase (phytanoyl-CoA dioxygenase family)
MTSEQTRQLDELGYVLLEDCMGPALLQALRERIHQLFVEEGEQAGSEFLQEPRAHRLANLVDKGEVFARAIVLPAVVAGVGHVLGPSFKLSSLNARSADPDSETGQPLHVDMGAVADDRGYWVCNTVWMLDDFTPDNGATRMVPGSHRWGQRPQDVLADVGAAHPDEVLLTGRAGSVAVMNALLWHGGTANRTAAPRLAMHAFYCRSDKPQQQYQKRLLRREVQAGLSGEVRRMLALDDPLNDELSAAAVPRSGFLK